MHLCFAMVIWKLHKSVKVIIILKSHMSDITVMSVVSVIGSACSIFIINV